MTGRRTGECDSSFCLFPCMTNMQRSVKVEYIERGISQARHSASVGCYSTRISVCVFPVFCSIFVVGDLREIFTSSIVAQSLHVTWHVR